MRDSAIKITAKAENVTGELKRQVVLFWPGFINKTKIFLSFQIIEQFRQSIQMRIKKASKKQLDLCHRPVI
jgi:hypothetical protein